MKFGSGVVPKGLGWTTDPNPCWVWFVLPNALLPLAQGLPVPLLEPEKGLAPEKLAHVLLPLVGGVPNTPPPTLPELPPLTSPEE